MAQEHTVKDMLFVTAPCEPSKLGLKTSDKEDYPLVFAARNKSDEVRHKSSSGGVFYALASWVIEQGGVVYGCAFDKDFHAIHVRCNSLPACERCMGSKYSQSDMLDTIALVRADLVEGRYVLFTGTPCQVAAVRASCENLAQADSLLTADIICHGVPSPTLFASHLEFLRAELGKDIVSYSHRNKDLGWGHVESVGLSDGTILRQTRFSDSWKRLFYNNRMLRPSCYECPYTSVKRVSDITIADFWKMDQTLGMKDDGLGTSLVLANNERGLETLCRSELNLLRAKLEDALLGNPLLQSPSVSKGPRNEPWEILFERGYASMMRELGYLKPFWREIGSKAKRSILKKGAS